MGLMATVDFEMKHNSLKMKIDHPDISEGQSYYEVLLKEEVKQLESEARRLNIPVFIAVSLMRRADVLMALQEYRQVIDALLEARRTLGRIRKHDLVVYILGKLAEAHSYLEEWENVLSISAEGIEIVEQHRYQVTPQYIQSSYLKPRIQLYTLGVQAAYELENYPLMLEIAELSKCRSVLRYHNHSIANSESQEEINQQFQKVCENIDSERQEGKNTENLEVKRRILWDKLVIERFKSRTRETLTTFNLKAIQKVLALDEAIIYYYWLDQEHLIIITIDRENLLFELHFISENNRKQIKEFTDHILTNKDIPNEGYVKKCLKNFSLQILPQKAEVKILLKRKQHLLISPHRLLHAIPFSFLTFNDTFLIEQFAITHIPNLSSLLLNYSVPITQNVLAIGNCEYDVRGINLKPLAQAEKEVKEIEKIYNEHSIPITVLKGAEAKETQLIKREKSGDLTNYSCLHFAIHGENIESDTPMESRLYLRDSVLDGLEIANWKLNAETVFLSACCSGQRAISGRGMAELPGDDLFGLQAAFFTAGVKRVISALWPIEDNVGYEITTYFHSYLVHDNEHRPEIALQRALKKYLTTVDTSFEDFLKYAAPFFLSAIGRSRLSKCEIQL